MLSEAGFQIQPVNRAQFGVGSISKLGKHVKSVGQQRALIVTDTGLVKAGVVTQVTEALAAEGIEARVFDGVRPNPTTEDVTHGRDAARDFGEAAVVPVGGGSVLDAAKAIALWAPNSGELADYVPGCKPKHAGYPVIAVPTTSGTGAETNMFAVITDPKRGRKILIGHLSVQPKASVLDPALTVGCPPAVTATCGMDVLTHAIEALTSNRPNPFSEAVALRAIAMAGHHLPVAFEDGANLEARSQLMFASHLAGIAFASAGLGVCHAMGHPISARLNAAHGQTLATLLPEVMRFNCLVSETKYAQVAIALGVAEPELDNHDNAQLGINAIEHLRAQVKTDISLADLGVSASLLPTLVEDAFADPLMITTPRRPEAQDVMRIYETCMAW
ncbi:MAG: iron-containing alcohol dehydrogenase [Polyangiaceae bacterium]|nr:iron-containing alcohol dehydrogenase [Polyangiaceae bacterium]MCB9606233.1 iron-containing alcohol dehydrogenase [Polyangiaceae bacterium]